MFKSLILKNKKKKNKNKCVVFRQRSWENIGDNLLEYTDN